MTDNKEVIAFFERIKEIIPVKENGEINIDKFKEVLFNGNKSNPILQYIYSKIPEYFVRGGTLLEPFYRICTIQEEEQKDYDEVLLRKIASGDLSDIKQFELVFPYIKKLATFFQGMDRKAYEVGLKLWKEGKVIPESWHDEFLKYQKIYYTMLKEDGTFYFEEGESKYIVGGYGGIVESDFQELLSANPNHRELLKFGYKLKKCYDLCNNPFGSSHVFDEFNRERLDSFEKYHQKEEKEILRLEAELEDIDEKLKKYGPVASLFKKREKEELLKEKEKIQKEIAKCKNNNTNVKVQLEVEEATKEFVENYRKQYVKCIIEELIPEIKSKIEKECEPHEQEILKQLVDNIVNNFLTSKDAQNTVGDPLEVISKQISLFKDASFDEFISKFDNALITTVGIPKVILDFEKLENKDLYSILNIIRKDLMKIPTDSDHGELSNEFRTKDLGHRPSDDFFACTTLGKDVNAQIEKLNKEVIELMKIDDIHEYIKKAGIIWYKFLLIHPYADGNGRTSRYLLNALLAHKNIIIPSPYISMNGQREFNYRLDKYIVHRPSGKWDFDGLGEEFLRCISEIAIDLSNQDRLEINQEKEIDEEDITNRHSR